MTFRDSSRRSAAIGGAVVTVLLAAMFVMEGWGLWRPLGQAWTWAILAIPALVWTIWFATRTTYQVAVDDDGITRRQGRQRARLRWSEVAEVVALPTRAGHLALLSVGAERDRTPGETSLIRAFRLPHGGMVVRDDAELRATIVERSGRRVRAPREVVGP